MKPLEDGRREEVMKMDPDDGGVDKIQKIQVKVEQIWFKRTRSRTDGK